MPQLNFDANTVQPQAAIEPVPTDWYTVIIEESEMRPTSKGDGSFLRLVMKIIDGPYANRKLFTNLNLNNPNPTASEIAYQQLSAICHAVGMLQIQDSQQLHGLPFQVRVTVRPPKDGYDAQNECKGFKAVAGTAAPNQAPAMAAPTPPPPTAQTQQYAAPQPAQSQQYTAPPVQQGTAAPMQENAVTQNNTPPVQQNDQPPAQTQVNPAVQNNTVPPWAGGNQ